MNNDQILELNELTLPEDSPHYCQALISIITGYDLDEVLQHCTKEKFYTSDFKRIFNELGFQCGQRFEKFDPETTVPGIARAVRWRVKENGWYPFVYYRHKLYDSHVAPYFYKFLDTDYKITSFLPVYVV